jgi:hypothetical protein
MKQWQGKMILSWIRDNGNEVAWKIEPNCHFVQKAGQKTGRRMKPLNQ